VQALFDRELESLGQGTYRQAIYAKVKALAVRELWERDDVRRTYLDVWCRSGLTAGLTATAAVQPDAETAFPDAIRTMAAEVFTPVLTSGGKIRVATSAADIEEAHRSRGHALIIGWENSTPIGADLGRVDLFYNYGVRSVQLTYNLRNLVGDGCMEPAGAGLSRFGAALIERLNEKRMIVDVSHASEALVADAARASRSPVSMNHTGAKSVYRYDRNASDESLKAVAATGGYVGVYVVAAFLQANDEGTLDQWADHVEHIARLVGVDKVGIGCDSGDIYQVPPERATFASHYPPTYPWHGFTERHRTHFVNFDRYRTMLDWPNLTVELAQRGFNEQEIRGIIGGNYLRLFRDVVG
jgi:membrane dipeptidase